MMRIVTEALAAIAGSFALSLAVNVTVVTAVALIETRIARRSRTSVRHLVLAATFIVLLAFPFAEARATRLLRQRGSIARGGLPTATKIWS